MGRDFNNNIIITIMITIIITIINTLFKSEEETKRGSKVMRAGSNECAPHREPF